MSNTRSRVESTISAFLACTRFSKRYMVASSPALTKPVEEGRMDFPLRYPKGLLCEKWGRSVSAALAATVTEPFCRGSSSAFPTFCTSAMSAMPLWLLFCTI